MTNENFQKPYTALKKPPIAPKGSSPNKFRDTLEPPDGNYPNSNKPHLNNNSLKTNKNLLKQQSPLSAKNIKYFNQPIDSVKSATLQMG